MLEVLVSSAKLSANEFITLKNTAAVMGGGEVAFCGLLFT